jgi:hypothetical protein
MERTLNSGLSGEEIVLALLDKIGMALRRDCFLNRTTNYRYFDGKVIIDISMNDVPGDTNVHKEVRHTLGAPPADTTPTTAHVEIDLNPDSPNTVRIETGQAVPVLTKDENGRMVEKGVQYARPGDNKAKTAAKKAAAAK